MNTNTLKKFARNARTKLMQQISTKLEQVLHTDSIAFREKDRQIEQLAGKLRERGKAALIEEVAYTWFNRFMALRFMDANGYTGVRVVSPAPGDSLPEILQEAKQGHVDEELQLDRQRLFDLLDGNLPSANPQNEVYQMLLVAECNRWHKTMPFMFQRIQDYTELLMPDDVLSEHSIVHEIREGMSEEDCRNVEIIGWLYQFYIAEKKDEVFASKGKVKKEEIPAATQLFTPRWIVEYLVQNTLGKLWLQNKPQSKLKEAMPYYVEPVDGNPSDFLKIDSVEDIRFLDQACGSGHILVYAFDLFAKIYEEEGYSTSEVPGLILEKNLFGFEIDERAAQLAGFALLMKARSYYRRLFRKEVKPNIMLYRDLSLSPEEIKSTLKELDLKPSQGLLQDLDHMRQATNLGSLILPKATTEEIQKMLMAVEQQLTTTDLFFRHQLEALKMALQQLWKLAQQYDCIVDNPPYMGGGKMNKPLADFVKKNYPDGKSDLMACFMESGLAILKEHGFVGMINQHSWMFLSSYERLREKLVEKISFDTLLHLGPRTFPEIGGEVVQNAAFTFLKREPIGKGSYFRLVDFENTILKKKKTLEAINNPNCGWFFTANQKDFAKIPGSPIGYWLSENMFKVFDLELSVKDIANPNQALVTGNTEAYIRKWQETAFSAIGFDFSSRISAKESNLKWFPYNKGGSFRKWFGNNYHIVNWQNDGFLLQNTLHPSGKRIWAHNFILDFIFKKGIVWSKITSSTPSFRLSDDGFLYDDASGVCAVEDGLETYLLALFISKINYNIQRVINPTLNIQPKNLEDIPFKIERKQEIENFSSRNISISRIEWDSHETSWDFQQNELIKQSAATLQAAYQTYQTHWRHQFAQLHANEEELNRIFIEIYGLEDELTPEVALEDITILKDELDGKALKEATKAVNKVVSPDELTLSGSQLSGSQLKFPIGSVERFEFVKNALVFKDGEVLAQLVSYAVGCMMGRYSLDQPGLILANQGEGLEEYAEKVGPPSPEASADKKWSFTPDDDGIIPLLADDYFTDDVVGRFRTFLKAAFGEAHFEENLRFVEEALGRDIRSYFVREFYKDHIKRYKKRPIYWLFSSPGKHFQALVYLHRYRPDTVSKLLNDYLREFIRKLEAQRETLIAITLKADVTAREKTQAQKEIDQIDVRLEDARQYEREILYPLAAKKLPLDLDDGVLVNYNRMGKAVLEVRGLNDAKAGKKVRGFDWVTFDD